MTLLLFSSNLRPLYEQDIVDFAAAPPGNVIRFRYDLKHVALELRDKWAAIKGREVLVVYTIKQPEDYHDPAYIPIRYGIVADAFREGNVCVVECRAGGFAPLGDPAKEQGARGKKVRSFTAALSATLGAVGHPGAQDPDKRYFVVETLIPQNHIITENDANDFERLVEYLSKTVSFSTHLFWRVLGIREAGSSKYLDADGGRFKLKVDTSYELIIVHRQARDVGGGGHRFKLQTDKSLIDVVGADDFEINSPYDSIVIRLRVPMRQDRKETSLLIRPAEGTRGPQCDVRIIVGPNNGQAVAGGLMAVSLPVLVGIPSLLGTEAPVGIRIACVVLGAVVAFMTLLWSPWRR